MWLHPLTYIFFCLDGWVDDDYIMKLKFRNDFYREFGSSIGLLFVLLLFSAGERYEFVCRRGMSRSLSIES